jgi:tetratricopeptide (TPR) repeat protein
LGRAYLRIPEIANFDEAEHWTQESLRARAENDHHGRGRCFSQLGAIFLHQAQEESRKQREGEEIASLLAKAAQMYEAALSALPSTAIRDRGVIHNQLGVVYTMAGRVEKAVQHFQQDIRICEDAGDRFGAGQARFNLAGTLWRAGRLGDARAYAEAALENYRVFGEDAAAQIREAEELISKLDRAEAGTGSRPASGMR